MPISTSSGLAYREDSPENRTFNRSCRVGAGRKGDLVQSGAGCTQVSAASATAATYRRFVTAIQSTPSVAGGGLVLTACVP